MKNKINLICDTCLNSNYSVKKSSGSRLEIKKFCPTCNKHTIHKENK
ncbi:MAG: 50S ribosomal protein L33 [Mycoplasmatales bacterium]